MAECILMKSGTGTGSDDCSATKADILTGKTAVTKDSDDEAVGGTMPNKGAWASRIGVNGKVVIPAGYHNGLGYVDQAINNRGAVNASLAINGVYVIPEGYHNGAGKVMQSVATMGAQTVTPGNSQKVVSCGGKYMTGNVTVPAVTNLVAANIKKGVTVGGVTGTWEGYVAGAMDLYRRGVRNYGLTNGYAGTTYKNNIKFQTAMLEYSADSIYTCWLYTETPINLTAYSGVKIILSKNGAGGSNFRLNFGSSVSAPGSIEVYLKQQQVNTTETTVYVPFGSKAHALTTNLGITVSNYEGSYIHYFYEISLY